GRLCRYHVECGHGLGKVHGIVEPELPVVGFRKLNMVRIGRLRPFGSRYDLHRAGQRELPGLKLRIHSALPMRDVVALRYVDSRQNRVSSVGQPQRTSTHQSAMLTYENELPGARAASGNGPGPAAAALQPARGRLAADMI